MLAYLFPDDGDISHVNANTLIGATILFQAIPIIMGLLYHAGNREPIIASVQMIQLK